MEHSRIEQILLSRLSKKDVQQWVHHYAAPYREMMAYYRCAMMAVETKFRVLSEELSLQYDHNPIETIKTRLKSPESIVDKMSRRGYPLTVKSIEDNLNDIAGVRVVCSFMSDIFMLADALVMQDDIKLYQKKDYIAEPKPNGYRSLHLVVGIPIYLHDSKRIMKVEVQLRTISMDWWASTEHKIRYKKNYRIPERIDTALLECAKTGAEMDRRMEEIHKIVEAENQTEKPRMI
ncbi:MAG: GTP pyrophosphokinase family protein [Eubacterium sp.]|nr:GTP pyrophosphokinase family protein [Eubacterium sp.]